MLSSITPLGERGRNNRFAVAASFFIAGSLLGGALLGAAAGLLGTALLPRADTVDGVLVVMLGLIGAALDARVGGLRLPTIKRQVDERWLQKYRSWVYGFGFGAQLGAALVTVVSSAAVYLMVMAAVLTRSMVAGAAIGLVFGAVRGASILLGRRLGTPEQLRILHRRLAANAARSERLGILTQGVISASAVLVIVGSR